MNEMLEVSAVALIAFASPIISQKVKVPAVILEIMAGFGLAMLFGSFASSEWFGFFSVLGLIFLMFLSGLEIDFALIIRKSKRYWKVPIYVFSSIALAFALTSIADLNVIYAVFLANVSLGIVMPVLKEAGMSSTEFGQKILLATFVTDLVTISLLSGIALGYRSSGSQMELLLPLLLFPAFIFAYYFGRFLIWHFPDFMARFFDDPMELGVRGSFAIMIIFSGLAYILGSEAILGAFLAGALISLVFRGAGKLEESLMGVGYGIFIPFFFIKTGVDMFNSIGEMTLYFPLFLLALGLVVKVIPAIILVRDFGAIKALGFGIIQSSKLGLTLAGAEIARELGIISSGEAVSIALWTVISALVFPTAFRLMVRE
ncbi:Kef-type K+ transport system, membrane component [Geoglobus ahangari]|uniref:Kef-type K+ transport system, membrane component n=1 Tax=Geoglobus ahangari TaxID=113653 RepID=A0A0F7DBF5_9EURY|nr:cation:proton antiporter [Geoglobus ahangari]AKG91001.1 Kef-type K+ transport system, membrane component [Geoglobus ahangari]